MSSSELSELPAVRILKSVYKCLVDCSKLHLLTKKDPNFNFFPSQMFKYYFNLHYTVLFIRYADPP
jgi:hypothetical protein